MAVPRRLPDRHRGRTGTYDTLYLLTGRAPAPAPRSSRPGRPSPARSRPGGDRAGSDHPPRCGQCSTRSPAYCPIREPPDHVLLLRVGERPGHPRSCSPTSRVWRCGASPAWTSCGRQPRSKLIGAGLQDPEFARWVRPHRTTGGADLLPPVRPGRRLHLVPRRGRKAVMTVADASGPWTSATPSCSRPVAGRCCSERCPGTASATPARSARTRRRPKSAQVRQSRRSPRSARGTRARPASGCRGRGPHGKGRRDRPRRRRHAPPGAGRSPGPDRAMRADQATLTASFVTSTIASKASRAGSDAPSKTPPPGHAALARSRRRREGGAARS
ncbi:hypothetical protein HBB16_09500 [Pseudonocardia sp. MCCB 268]|nr:hypothetical protein [Pseudonocardia cytotoxica]